MAQKPTNKSPPKPSPKVTVIRGKAAEAMMASMQREAKREQRAKGGKR